MPRNIWDWCMIIRYVICYYVYWHFLSLWHIIIHYFILFLIGFRLNLHFVSLLNLWVPFIFVYCYKILEWSKLQNMAVYSTLFWYISMYLDEFLQVGIKSIDPTLRKKYINIYILLIYHTDFGTMYNVRAYYTCQVFQTSYFEISHMTNIWRSYVPIL